MPKKYWLHNRERSSNLIELDRDDCNLLDMEPTLKELLIGRLEIVRSDLNDVLKNLEGVDLDWAPGEGMKSVSAQLQEIAGTERQQHAILNEQVDADHDQLFRDCHRTTLADYVVLLGEVRAETNEMIQHISDSELERMIPIKAEWFESLNCEMVPKAEIFRSMAAHEWYHVGQLVSYVWIRGISPYLPGE